MNDDSPSPTKVFLPSNDREPVSRQQSAANAMRPEVRAAAEAYFESGDALYGDRVPALTVLTEKPVHRLMIYAHAQGKTASEIAKETGYQAGYVGQVLRQPWARTRLLAMLREAGMDPVKHFLKTEVSPSLEVLREIRDDTKVAAASRLTAASAILDRALGKPTVNVITDNTNREVPADMAKLEQELASVRGQLGLSTAN